MFASFVKFLKAHGQYTILVLVIFLLPWQAQYIFQQGSLGGELWQYGTVSLYAVDILIILLCLSVVLSKRREQRTFPAYLWFVLCAIMAAAFFSVIFAQNQLVSWYHVLVLFEGIALFWLLSREFFSSHSISFALVSAGILQSVLATVQFFTQKVFSSTLLGTALHVPEQVGQSVIEADGRFLRAYGTFQHPNLLAAFLAICLLFGIARYLTSRGKGERSYIISGIMLMTFALVLTMSRAAWGIFGAAFVVAIAIFCLTDHFKLIRRKVYFLVIAVALSLAAGVMMTAPLITTRIQGEARLEVQSTTERLSGYQDAWKIFKDSWLHGTGIGMFTETVHLRVDPSRPMWEVQPVHNIYVLITDEISIFGIVFFLLLIYEVVQMSLRKARGFSEPWGIMVLITLLSTLVFGLFDHYFWTLHSGVLLFWVVLGLSVSYANKGYSQDVDKSYP